MYAGARDAARVTVPGVEPVSLDIMVNTDLTAALNVEKMPPADFVKIVLDGLENGHVEIVADDLSVRAKAALAGEPRLLVP